MDSAMGSSFLGPHQRAFSHSIVLPVALDVHDRMKILEAPSTRCMISIDAAVMERVVIPFAFGRGVC